MNIAFQTLEKIVEGRRTQKVNQMNGENIPAPIIEKLLQLADWAPTHGKTEPWRFIVYGGASLEQFCYDHARMYWEHTPVEKRQDIKFSNLKDYPEKASHLVIVVMKRTPDTKIPLEEEYAATAAAVQNLLLGAAALDIAAIWSTGGMAHRSEMKTYLGLEAEDKVVAFVYLGRSREIPKKGMRRIPLFEKIIWQ